MYNYQQQKSNLFTEKGQVLFLAVRDRVWKLLKVAGAIRLHEASQVHIEYDGWDMLACFDRLVELGELREISSLQTTAGQDRVFVSARLIDTPFLEGI